MASENWDLTEERKRVQLERERIRKEQRNHGWIVPCLENTTRWYDKHLSIFSGIIN